MTAEIRALADDEIITEPGLYRCSLDRHHAQPCMTRERLAEIQAGAKPEPHEVSVTSGILRTMELQTPADVWAFHTLNPDRYERKETPALRMGRAMAAIVEGGLEELGRHYVVPDPDAPNRPMAKQIAAYDKGEPTEAGKKSVEYWRAMDADTREVLPDAEFDLIVSMGGVLAQTPEAVEVMAGLPEVTIAWQCPETGLWVLSRPDTVSLAGIVTDYKKISPRGGAFNYRLVDRRITEHGYDMQLALATEALEVLGHGWPPISCIIAQSDTPPYFPLLREIPDHVLRIAQFRNRRQRVRFAECLTNQDWPGPGADTGAYEYPEWLATRLAAEMQTAHQ